MSNDLAITFKVDQSPETVFAAINNVRKWWSGNIEGNTDKLGEEWIYRYQDIHYSKQKITELSPNIKVVWHVVDSYLNFVEDKDEWTGTDIIFEIKKEDAKTKLTFIHQGLVPKIACYEKCASAWDFYINNSLRNFITTGKGDPNDTS
jgi:hypothetical protein